MSNDRVTPDQKLALQRAATGLLAGLALYALFQIKTPATVIAPLILACVFAPLMLVQGWRAIAPRLLAGWVGVATLVILGLGLYDKLRITPGSITDDVEATVAAPLLWMAIAVSLFIGQALVTAASLSGRRIAPYETYFDLAWTQGVQVAATFAFTVVLWLSLFLGAQLFELINIKVLDDLIHERWFSFPVTTLAVALALHVTDVRPGIIRGIRSLVHTLLTWLLPLMTVLAVGFIATLPFTGLSPLWSTRFATQLLLTVAAALVILINVAYQGGSQEETLPRAFRYASLAAAAALTPLVALAAIALSLRVSQYGWTGDRVIAASAIVIAACYAIGYGWAVIATLRAHGAVWMGPLQTTNVATSYAVLAVLFVLFTPLGDPARIGADSQLARLRSGLVPPEKFDFAYLRFQTARYGVDALNAMAADQAGQTGQRARAALAMTHRIERSPLTEPVVATRVTVHPSGKSLPDSFLAQDWTTDPRHRLPACLTNAEDSCEALMIDLDGDGRDEILMQPTSPDHAGIAYRQDETGEWTNMGAFNTTLSCKAVLESFRSGGVRAVPSSIPDLEIGGTRIRIDPPFVGNCVADTPTK